MLENIPPCFYRTSIKALIYNDVGWILLAKEINGSREFPWGGLDFGEQPQHCLRREIKEELWIDVLTVADAPTQFLTVQNTKWYYIANVFYVTTIKNLEFIPSDECLELKYFTKQELAEEKHLFSNVRKFFDLMP